MGFGNVSRKPRHFIPTIPDLLRRAKPNGKLIFEKDPWPDENDRMEKALREALADIGSMPADEGRQNLEKLEAEHGQRRDWVWAQLGLSPLANAVGHLSALAHHTASALGGDTADGMAKLYAEGGYLADNDVLRALASVKTAEDLVAVQAAVRCVYLPWLEDTARNFQQCLEKKALPSVEQQGGVEAHIHDCILFVDALRFDIGQRLAVMAGERRVEVSTTWRWAALPTVTATAKPAVSPIIGKFRGGNMGVDFCPEAVDNGERLNSERFRRLISVAGYQVFGPGENG